MHSTKGVLTFEQKGCVVKYKRNIRAHVPLWCLTTPPLLFFNTKGVFDAQTKGLARATSKHGWKHKRGFDIQTKGAPLHVSNGNYIPLSCLITRPLLCLTMNATTSRWPPFVIGHAPPFVFEPVLLLLSLPPFVSDHATPFVFSKCLANIQKGGH